MPWLLGALGVVLLGYVGVCLFYYFLQERFIFIRFRTPQNFRYPFTAPFSEHWLDRPDGSRLHALYFSVPEPKGVVLFFHGHSGTVRRWGKLAGRFTSLGFDVLIPDPRGYGKSRGPSTEKALIDDAVAWFDHLCERWTHDAIVPYGRSLGSGLAVPVASQRVPRMLLLETPFANFRDVAMSYLPILPYRWLLLYHFKNDEAMRDVRCPVYIFHGRKDPVVPYASAAKLYAAVPATVHREMLTFPLGRHNNLYRFARFRNTLRRLLNGT